MEPAPSPAEGRSVEERVKTLVALASLAYGFGFFTVMLHSYRLGLPVIELIQPIYIWIGTPLTIVLVTFSYLSRLILWNLSNKINRIFKKPAPNRSFKIAWLRVEKSDINWRRVKNTIPFALWLQVINLAAASAALLYIYVWHIYPTIPQSLGGGKPMRVLVLFSNIAIPEGDSGLESTKMIQSSDQLMLEVQLVYQGKDFMYFLLETGRHIAIRSSSVNSILWEP